MAPTRSGPDLTAVLERSRDRGYLGPGSVTEHVAHAEAFAAVLDEGFEGQGVDLGTGGGVPGLALAAWFPKSRWLLVDASLQRVRFLDEAVRELGLEGRTETIHRRAEDLGRSGQWRGGADAVVSRSFGPPAVVAECAAPLLRAGGILAVSEPPRAERVRWPSEGTEQLGLRLRFQGRRAGYQMAVLVQSEACSERFPRRAGVPERAPLF